MDSELAVVGTHMTRLIVISACHEAPDRLRSDDPMLGTLRVAV